MNPRPNAAAFALSVAWLGLNLLPVTVAAQAPPTGLQNPLPTPALPLPTGDRPLKSSPTSKDLEAYIAKRTLNIQDVVAIALATNRTLATQVEAYLQAHGNTIAARSGCAHGSVRDQEGEGPSSSWATARKLSITASLRGGVGSNGK